MKDNTSDEDYVHIHPYKVDKNEQNKGEQKIEISPHTKDNQIANQIIAKRDKQIQQLKKQIDEGTYKVQSMKVAEKMLSYFNKK